MRFEFRKSSQSDFALCHISYNAHHKRRHKITAFAHMKTENWELRKLQKKAKRQKAKAKKRIIHSNKTKSSAQKQNAKYKKGFEINSTFLRLWIYYRIVEISQNNVCVSGFLAESKTNWCKYSRE